MFKVVVLVVVVVVSLKHVTSVTTLFPQQRNTRNNNIMSNIILNFQYERYYLQCSAVCTAITDPLSTLKIIAIYSVQFILYILSALERLVCTVTLYCLPSKEGKLD